MIWQRRGKVGRGWIGGVLGLLFVGCSGGLEEEAPGHLWGEVRDELGRIVVGARVFIEGTALDTTTDKEGQFRFKSLPIGNYVVIAEAYDGSLLLRGESEPVRVSGGGAQFLGSIVLRPTDGPQPGALSGFVIDTNGQGVLGADVRLQGLPVGSPAVSTKTSIQGGYLLRNVPANWGRQPYSLVVTAVSLTGQQLRGVRSGLWVREGETLTNADVALAPLGQTATISGRVYKSNGQPAEEATVIAELLAPSVAETYGLIRLSTDTDTSGSYVLAEVPVMERGVRLWATAPRHESQWFTRDFRAGQIVHQDFFLVDSLSPQPARPTNTWALALTYPQDISRGGSVFERYRPIRRALYRQRGGNRGQRLLRILEDSASHPESRAASRRPPQGKLVEVDVGWDEVTAAEVAGYRLYRSLFENQGYVRVGDINNPAATLGIDLSDELSVETRFYYRVAAYVRSRYGGDTESGLSDFASVVPLEPLEILEPANGDVGVSRMPTFRWQKVTGAEIYTVQLYDQFPTTDIDPLWQMEVPAPQTFALYNGLPLVEGRTYSWVVAAQDATDPNDVLAESYSAIWRFTVRALEESRRGG